MVGKIMVGEEKNKGLVENTITKYFEADHDRLDSLLKEFQITKNLDYKKAKEYFKEFRFGLQRHIIWEEDILFPLFEKKTGMTAGPTHVMKSEHEQIGEYLESIHKKVQKEDPNSNEDEQKLLFILSNHNIKEEDVLYPAIDKLISDDERKKVFEAMKNIPEERYKTCCNHS